MIQSKRIWLLFFPLITILTWGCQNEDTPVLHSQLLEVSFLKENNVGIDEDVNIAITDSLIVVSTRFIHDLTKLQPTFKFCGEGKIYVGDVLYKNGSSFDFSQPVGLKFETEDGIVSVYSIRILESGLPVVLIDTPDSMEIENKETWMKGARIRIYNAEGKREIDTSTSIKGRGNSTWTYPKKPYAIKLDEKSEILGMPKHKRWVLLANWIDRTLIRNAVAFEISKATDLDWTPNGRFVELILNGRHMGNYYLCEQIKVDKNRVNITEMKKKDIDGDAITGGYLMELGKNFDEVNKFYSRSRNLPYMFKEPDEDDLQPEQLTYFQNYINTMESYLYAENWLDNREYAEYMDIGSFVDWWFVYELTMNWEPNHPKSAYVYKDRLGKLKAGPVWDFDYGTFRPVKAQSYTIISAIYYDRLFSDPVFVAEVKSRWFSYKSRFEQVPIYVKDIASQIKNSNYNNNLMWPLPADAINGDAEMTFDDAVERIISAYETKLNWLDGQINNNFLEKGSSFYIVP